eukprot:2848112-Pleurochrysis_carterae.AAC.2
MHTCSFHAPTLPASPSCSSPFASALGAQTIVSENKLSTWLGTFGYCEPSDHALNEEAGDALHGKFGGANAANCVNPFALYNVCIFWALTLIAGYSVTPFPGPYPAYYSEEKGPFTSSELAVLTIITFVCAISWVSCADHHARLTTFCVGLYASTCSDGRGVHKQMGWRVKSALRVSARETEGFGNGGMWVT